MDSEGGDQTTVVVLTSNEEVKGKLYKIVTALETSFYKDVEEWKDTTIKRRPAAYLAYKKERTEKIMKRITDFYPEYENRLEVIEAASMLSYRDFLHTPDGSAYGVKQKIGQINLFGRLPFRNLYVSGQSSVLPGIVGAMMSSFIIMRALIGRENYEQFIQERLPI
jgi:all-trans-retinol 13,14-reductase